MCSARLAAAVLFAVAACRGAALAEAPAFRLHAINADSTYSACAVFDVDDDGRLDVVSGGWWYEAPSWKKHFVRNVQRIRGRYDGYSHLPLDVDGDGWTDFISANYRSQKLYWIEHPGEPARLQPDSPWQLHEIAMPGPMETARLHDVDGDGQVDVLPNGVRFAAWWELRREPGDSGFEWVRHELPREVAGHGVGFGDIDGDGRGDVVGPRGWAEAPEDRRRQRWRWHPEFRLHRDCAIPILVLDVDEDGDNDVLWARGHHTGLYWLEQTRSEPGRVAPERNWTFHAIDTSWSQPHSLLLGDLDNDGRREIVAGKRYMGHDGKDPGEYNPLVVAAYTFEPKTRTFRRNLISETWRAGFGLDPKLADLDGDGDLDIIGPGRSGLFWWENLRGEPSETSRGSQPAGTYPEAHASGSPQDHTDLSWYMDETGARQKVASPADWARRRARVLENMQAVMGALPDSVRRVPLDVEVLEETETESYLRKRIRFASEPGDRVPAWLLIPKDLRRPAPGMLCLHSTVGIGKDQPAGLGGRRSRQYGDQLARRGYVCIIPDYPSFGDYKYDFEEDGYVSGSMKAVWNNVRAVDLLESLPEVDRDRIGVIGHSLGGHNGLFTAVFDLRIRAVATSCGFTGFHDYYGGELDRWAAACYMPLIREKYKNDPDRVPFDFYEILGALAPRPVFINAPVEDDNFEIAGVRKVVREAKRIYEITGEPEDLKVVYPNAGHDFPDGVRQQAYEWLDQQLKE